MSKRSINAFIKSTQFIGQPGKPIQPAVKYNSFLYIALDNKNQPKIGFTIGDRVLGSDYTFVWSWSLPKPIIIESKVKEQLRLFSKSNQPIVVDEQKYTTETFEIDILTLIHIVRLNILVMSAWMEYIPFTKDMKYLYERLDQRKFNYIACLDATYAIKTDPVNEKNPLDYVLINNEMKLVKDTDIQTPYTPVKASNYLNVDELYAFLKLNLRKLNIQTQSNIYPKDTFVSVQPLRKQGDFYIVEYNGTAMYVDQNILTKDQIKNLNSHLNKYSDKDVDKKFKQMDISKETSVNKITKQKEFDFTGDDYKTYKKKNSNATVDDWLKSLEKDITITVNGEDKPIQNKFEYMIARRNEDLLYETWEKAYQNFQENKPASDEPYITIFDEDTNGWWYGVVVYWSYTADVWDGENVYKVVLKKDTWYIPTVEEVKSAVPNFDKLHIDQAPWQEDGNLIQNQIIIDEDNSDKENDKD